MSFWAIYVSLEKFLFRSAYFFIGLFGFFLILNSMNYLYILETNHLSTVSFASIFSHSVGCLLGNYSSLICI